MNRSDSVIPSIFITIFTTGFIAGIFFGLYLITGENVNPEALLIKVGEMFCEALKNINPEASMQCKNYMFYTSVTLSIAGLLELVVLIAAAGDWRIGVLVYIIGFVLGVILVLLSGGG